MTRPRALGIGGVFFKSRDPKALCAWYAEHLGFDVSPYGFARFEWAPPTEAAAGYTLWTPFGDDTTYLRPSDKPFMLNLLVNDLEGLLARLRAAGVEVLDRRGDCEFGKFGYALDPDGTLLELWEPAPEQPAE